MDNNIKNNIKVLDELHKGVKIGLDSISTLAKKVNDENFKKELSFQYNQYDNILTRANDIYSKYNLIPNYPYNSTKLMTWSGIQMNTLDDKSNSKLSEILIQGNTMGIIEGRKLLNHNNNNIDTEIIQTLKDFVKLQENNISKLKRYL